MHIGWFVMRYLLLYLSLLARLIPSVASGKTFTDTYQWIPTLDINFTTYLDGLSMIFGLLITGVGSLVILYSFFILSTKESLTSLLLLLIIIHGCNARRRIF